MAEQCLAAIHICRLRVTRLDASGNPTAGPNNVYITDKPMVLNVTPTIEAGADRTLIGGCDCIIATYRGFDKLKRFDLEVDLGVLEPELIEMMIGADAITSASSPTDLVGVWWPSQAFQCTTPAQPNVCVEAWQTAWDGSGPSAVYPYVHWIWPATHWQIGAHTLQNDFNQPKLTGFSVGNAALGTGIFGDLPETVGVLGGWFYDTLIPTAMCGYQTQAIT